MITNFDGFHILFIVFILLYKNVVNRTQTYELYVKCEDALSLN